MASNTTSNWQPGHGKWLSFAPPAAFRKGVTRSIRKILKLTRVKDPKEKCLEVSTTDTCGKEAEPESA
ncbi:MAG: hypothetical protein ACRD8W_21830 [Nitrososphaeraceae archaeon]